MSEIEQTHTYKVRLIASFGYLVLARHEDEVPLEEFGYSDQEWDELTTIEQEDLLNEWSEQFANERVEYWGEIV
jgi:hypothetical protein